MAELKFGGVSSGLPGLTVPPKGSWRATDRTNGLVTDLFLFAMSAAFALQDPL